MSIIVGFHNDHEVPDGLLKFAVVTAQYDGKWVFCRHKDCDTYEIPGGHREAGEAIDDAARRELCEETGAVRFSLSPVCVYSVTRDSGPSFGKLYFAEIEELGLLPPEMEIREIAFFGGLPAKLTYPEIQPALHEKVLAWQARGC